MAKISIACIAVWNNKVLIAHRINKGQMANRWEFPGGKVDPGENDIQAVKREFKEEFGGRVKVLGKITKNSFIHNGVENQLHAYEIKPSHKGQIFRYKLTEHTEYRWVKLDEIRQYTFVDSDLKIYPDVKEYCRKKYGI